MSAELSAGARLYALIGEAVHNLPPRFVTKLERILKAQEESRRGYRPVVGLPSLQQRTPTDGSAADPRELADAWRCDLMLVDRKLRGLGAVLEVMQTAHLDVGVYDDVEEMLLGGHLVEGLLVVGRDLVASARDALRGGCG
ncbi:hypothetical protein [Stenotrophomonas tumulicola]|uniref:Uncharacterized protein n=1 Tax=Stenotrophomonas tumulicola TaxID=1685415 RepID=A0A7W3FK65_9GAMM|nr:hypothetical protein [Stenotrophomonas tumulicola]MBA8680727.1 hypothetical protein [Stenotrophomonas tumulicola]